MKRGCLLVMIFMAGSVLPVLAATHSVILKSGQTVEGVVTEKNDEHIVVDFQGTVMKLYADEVQSIDGQEFEKFDSQGDTARQSTDTQEGVLVASPDDQANLYVQRMTELILLSKRPDATEQEYSFVTDQLLKFTKDYPNSRFAKDARFIVWYFLLDRAGRGENRNEKRARDIIKEIKAVVSDYPTASLEELTCNKLVEAFEGEMPYIPFKYAVSYLRGYSGRQFEDFQSSIDNFSFIINNFESPREGKAIFLQEVYRQLISAYVSANRSEEAGPAIKETLEKFPADPLAPKYREMLGRIERVE